MLPLLIEFDFCSERLLLETREKELREKEADELETERQKKQLAAARNEQRAREAAAVDAEADAVEKACIVLKVSISCWKLSGISWTKQKHVGIEHFTRDREAEWLEAYLDN